MISKIIQKEKHLQEELLKEIEFFQEPPAVHKQSLINLKEYLEEELESEESEDYERRYDFKIRQFKEDIDELTKMIELYS